MIASPGRIEMIVPMGPHETGGAPTAADQRTWPPLPRNSRSDAPVEAP